MKGTYFIRFNLMAYKHSGKLSYSAEKKGISTKQHKVVHIYMYVRCGTIYIYAYKQRVFSNEKHICEIIHIGIDMAFHSVLGVSE